MSQTSWLPDRIGHSAKFTFYQGTVAIILCCVPIAVIWLSGPDNWIWHSLVASNWAASTVSASAALVRLIATAQAAICFSMLAALALETSCVAAVDIASISLLRADGDKGIVPVLIRLVVPIFLHPDRRLILCLAAGLLWLTTVFMQFLGPILSLDFASHPIHMYDATESVPHHFGLKVDADTPQGAINNHPRPVLWGGFIAATVILISHFFLAISIRWAFLNWTTVTRIGDSWQAVAQLAFSEVDAVKETLEAAATAIGAEDRLRDINSLYLDRERGIVKRYGNLSERRHHAMGEEPEWGGLEYGPSLPMISAQAQN